MSWRNNNACVCLFFSPCFRGANTADEGTFLQDTSSLQYQPGPGEGAQEQTRGKVSCLYPLCSYGSFLYGFCPSYHYFEICIFCIVFHIILFYSFIKSSDGAVIMYPINPQIVMSVTCQPSLVPAVPHGSVAPATCPFNQSGPGVASGQRLTQKPTQSKLCFLFYSLEISFHNWRQIWKWCRNRVFDSPNCWQCGDVHVYSSTVDLKLKYKNTLKNKKIEVN